MIEVNFASHVLDYDGRTIPSPVPGQPDQNQPLTLAAVCVNSLMIEDPQKPLTGEEKLQRHHLALKVHGTKSPVTLSAEDVILIKTATAKAYNALVYGRVVEAVTPLPLAGA